MRGFPPTTCAESRSTFGNYPDGSAPEKTRFSYPDEKLVFRGGRLVISSTSDYALRAVLVLAQAEPGCPMRADEIARATGSPANYLAKTLNALAKGTTLTPGRIRMFGLESPNALGQIIEVQIDSLRVEAARSAK